MNELKEILICNNKKYTYYSLKKACQSGLKSIENLPKSLKILLENILRNHEDITSSATWSDAVAINDWIKDQTSTHSISFYPTRVLLQDFTGVPALIDLAAMRDAVETLGGSSEQINPLIPVDLVIDHSVEVNNFGSPDSFNKNVNIEYKKNFERYQFLKWGQKSFSNFRVIPPGTGIVHQVNLEFLATVVSKREVHENYKGVETVIYPDTCVGTDSHTTMINGLSVLAWGVGGIEAEAAMLGQPISLIIPEVIGFKLTGKLKEGVTATDLVLTITEKLRSYGVVEKFVEFFGNGVKELSLTDRATLGNMSPEYGATCAFFPIDEKTIDYLRLTGRKEENLKLIESYAKKQGLWAYQDEEPLTYTDIIELNLDEVSTCIAGPRRPQDKINLKKAKKSFYMNLTDLYNIPLKFQDHSYPVENKEYTLEHGSIVIAAITSCTNTSNPSVMIAAGLLAKKAVENGMQVKPWVKTSLAPGSQVVTDYLKHAGLQQFLDQLGFNLVGYGCTTCIGNSGPLDLEISNTINKHELVATAILSGNRNFESRINPDVKANFLASPPLIIAYALAGSMKIDLMKDSLGVNQNGKDIFLKDLWPSNEDVENIINSHITKEMFQKRYAHVFEGDKRWSSINALNTTKYEWDPRSTYIKSPTFFKNIKEDKDFFFKVTRANILALFGDSITTDHISPAGSIDHDSPAASYLKKNFVDPEDFNSYGSRRGNYEVMVRGTFANTRIKNEMLPQVEGGYSKHNSSDKKQYIFDVAMKYKNDSNDLVIFAGKEYGSGSSRDWAAKGTKLLGIRAIIAEGFERIHRSNLIGMGVMPLEFTKGQSWKSLNIKGSEKISIEANSKKDQHSKNGLYIMTIENSNGTKSTCQLLSRIDTEDELDYYNSGGILHYMLRKLTIKNN